MELNCEYCKKGFESKRKTQKYCSPSCRTSAYNKRQTDIEEPPKETSIQDEIQVLNEVINRKNSAVREWKKEIVLLNQQSTGIQNKIDKGEQVINAKNDTIKKSHLTLTQEHNRQVEASPLMTVFNIARLPIEPMEKIIAGIAGYGLTKYIEPVGKENLQRLTENFRKEQSKFVLENKIWTAQKNVFFREINDIESKVLKLDSIIKRTKSEIEFINTKCDLLKVQVLKGKASLTRKERKLIAKYANTFDFKGTWKDFIGLPNEGFYIVLYGKAGQGKGFFCCHFAKYLSENFGKVLYISPEEANDTTLDDKLDFCGVPDAPDKFKTSHVDNIEKITKVIKEESPLFVFIDSLTACGITDKQMQIIKRTFPKVSFIGVVQTDKNGAIRGSNELTHNCQAVLKVEKGKVHQEKNRFSGWVNEVYEIKFPN